MSEGGEGERRMDEGGVYWGGGDVPRYSGGWSVVLMEEGAGVVNGMWLSTSAR